MTVLTAARAEPQSVRRGFEWRNRITLYASDADGTLSPQDLTGFIIDSVLSQTESKDGTAPSGVVIADTVVSTTGGVFDVSIAYDETDELTTGKSYWAMVYVTHATVTNGKPELIRIWKLKVPA